MENQTPTPEAMSREAKKAAQAANDRRQAQKAKLIPLFKIFGLVLIILAVIAGLIWIGEAQEGSTDQPSPIDNQVTESDHVQGPVDARITLIEYADFQCPTCAAFAPVVDQLLAEYPNDIRYVYRFFPLKSIHPNATIASQAAEAAGLQGKFWEMHDLLFENQREWEKLSNPRNTFSEYAVELGLDAERFKTDMDSKTVRQRVDADFTSATAARITGTPTFYLNGELLDNPRGYDAFKAVIDAKLQ